MRCRPGSMATEPAGGGQRLAQAHGGSAIQRITLSARAQLVGGGNAARETRHAHDSITPVVAVIVSPFVVALLAAWLVEPVPHRAGLLAAWPAGLAVVFGDELRRAVSDGARLVELPWAPSLGLSLSFKLDGLGLLFALLITGIGALDRPVCQPIPRRSPAGGPLLRVAVRLHGRDARCRAQRQRPHAVRLLGTHRLHVVPAHRLRARSSRRTVGGVAGPDRHRRGWPGAACRRRAAGRRLRHCEPVDDGGEQRRRLSRIPPMPPSSAWCCWRHSRSRRRCRFTSGCRTRWQRRPRSARISTRPPW